MAFLIAFGIILCFKDLSVSGQSSSFARSKSKSHIGHYFENPTFQNNSSLRYVHEDYDEIPNDALSIPASHFKSTSWRQTSHAGFSEKQCEMLNITYRGTLFWIIGSTNLDCGELVIYLDSQPITIQKLVSQTLSNNVICFESPKDITFGNHVISITSKDNQHAKINEIRYLPYGVATKNLNNSQMSGKKLQGTIGLDYFYVVGNKYAYSPSDKWTIYASSSTLSHSQCKFLNCSASYTFYGTKVSLIGRKDKALGEMDIHMDGRNISRVNAYSEETLSDKLLFDSGDLPYGKHTITIINRNQQATPLIEIHKLQVWPLPKNTGIAKNFRTIRDENSIAPTYWPNTGSADGFTGIYSRTFSSGLSFSFYGTKFWISGTLKYRYRPFVVTIDGKEIETVKTSIGDIGCTVAQKTAFLYESPDLSLSMHKIDISKSPNDYLSGSTVFIEFADFFYILQPKGATIVTPHDFQAEQWTINDDSISTSNPEDTAVFQMYGTNFWVFGQQSLTLHNVEITINDANFTAFTINLTDSAFNMNMLNLSERISLNYNSIEMINKGEIEINFAYYLNDHVFTLLPNLVIISYDTLEFIESSWSELVYLWEEETIEGISTNENSPLTIPFKGAQFWIEGSYDPNFGLVEIRLDDDFLGTVSLYREEHHSNQIYYQSKPIPYQDHRLELKNVGGKEISFNKLHVLTPSFAFTLSTYFTNSQSFSESTDFTKSLQFSQSTKFSDSEDFSNSVKFTPSSRFTSSISFSNSDDFSSSSAFSISDGFSNSLSFTPSDSDLFTGSDSFSFSVSFSLSISFSDSNLLQPKSVETTKNSVPIGAIVGIVVAILVIILVIILIIIIIRRKDTKEESDIVDSFECSAAFQDSMYNTTKDDPIEGSDSFIPYDPFNQAIEEMNGK